MADTSGRHVDWDDVGDYIETTGEVFATAELGAATVAMGVGGGWL